MHVCTACACMYVLHVHACILHVHVLLACRTGALTTAQQETFSEYVVERQRSIEKGVATQPIRKKLLYTIGQLGIHINKLLCMSTCNKIIANELTFMHAYTVHFMHHNYT